MSECQRQIEIESMEQFVSLFGNLDENVDILKQELGVNIFARGTELTVSGDAMRSQPGVAAAVMRAAASAMADVRLVTTSEVDISLLLTPPAIDDVAAAVRCALKALR